MSGTRKHQITRIMELGKENTRLAREIEGTTRKGIPSPQEQNELRVQLIENTKARVRLVQNLLKGTV